MRVIVRTAAALLLLAALVFAGGCGDDDAGSGSPAGGKQGEELSNQRYAEVLRSTMVELGTRLAAVDAASSPRDLDLDKREIKELGGTVRRTVDEFGAVDPPDDAQEGHDRVLAALEDFSSKFTDLADAVKADGRLTEESFTALKTATFELQDQYLQAQETLIDDGIETGVEPVGG